MRITNPYDKAHNRAVVGYQKEVERMWYKLYDNLVVVYGCLNNWYKPNEAKPFSFDDYPMARTMLDNLLAELHDTTQATIVSGINDEWSRANKKADNLVTRVFGENTELTDAQKDRYYSNHEEALQAFIGRKERGMNLSDRVWNYTNQFKDEIENAVGVMLQDRVPAVEATALVKQYLKYPDKLFRRVRDSNGKLQLSKPAKAFHPGRGVYRSSFKNARRLTATETNIAYRTADHERMKDLDFVVGIRINMSNNHTCNGVPLYDICDELAGDYPKSFKFVGWHPHCRCYVTSILKTLDELEEENDAIRRGELPKCQSVNAVTDVPEAFKSWVADNAPRYANKKQKDLPYFMKDNGTIVDGVWSLGITSPSQKLQKIDGATLPASSFSVERKKAALARFDEGGYNAQDVLFGQANRVLKRATADERTALSKYTYMSSFGMNKRLQGDPYIGDDVLKDINALTSLLEKTSLPKDMAVFRAEGLDAMQTRYKNLTGSTLTNWYDLVGKELTNDSFLSTSTRKVITDKVKWKDDNCVLTIYAPKGSKALFVRGGGKKATVLNDEAELLFQRGTRLRVTKVERKGGVWHIGCEVAGRTLTEL